jgi:hypothetical protein
VVGVADLSTSLGAVPRSPTAKHAAVIQCGRVSDLIGPVGLAADTGVRRLHDARTAGNRAQRVATGSPA